MSSLPWAPRCWCCDIDVLHETATLASGATTATVTLPTAVDPSRTLLLAGVRTASGTLEQAAVTAEFTADDQVTLRRTGTGVGATVELQVVQLLDGTAVQRGALTVGDTATTASAALASPVDTSRATVLATGTGWGGAAATGRASAGADAIGRVLGRLSTPDASTVRVTRGRSDGSTTWTYQAVTWGGPRWWDLAYSSRETHRGRHHHDRVARRLHHPAQLRPRGDGRRGWRAGLR